MMDMDIDEEPETEEVPVHVPSKIRFTEDVLVESNDVSCFFRTSSNCEIDLGLLSEGHLYQVRFFMAHQLGNFVDIPAIQTPAVIVTDLKKYEGRKGHRVTLEVKCGEKGFLDEQILFENNKHEKLVLKVIAKIMSTQSGTPALKGGIKVLLKSSDDMSDAETEWQGFDCEDSEL